ncbi:F-actin-uncapping protein LRRC16A [Aplochiton taeniatus]
MTETGTDIPSELSESVSDAVGRAVKLTLKRKVKLEVKGDKVENRVLALASHRVFLLTARVPSKVEDSLNYLDIQGVSSNKPTQLVLEYDRGQWPLRLGAVEEVDEVVAHIGFSLLKICPGVPPAKMRKLSLKPPERLAALQSIWEEQGTPDLGPCGGFSHMYWCLCDQLALPFREEVQWDVDTIYLTQDTRELNLLDFIHLENRDLVAIIGVLEFNQWFTKLSIKDYKLHTDVCEQVLRVVSRSSRLEELLLDNAGLRSDFAQKLASALSQNPASALHTLNLANNSLEDKGVSVLSVQLAKMPMGLKHLNLSRTSISPKGVNCLCQALCANPAVPSALSHLDLSGNSLRGDDLSNLYSFLGQSNHLVTLDLSNSDCSLDQVCSSLLRGSLKHLSVLNMSKCVFSHRKSKEIQPSFKQFFGSALSLSSVSLSGTRLPLEALKALLLGLGCNPNLSEVVLDLSCCELRSSGSQILEGCIAEIPNISSLDISDNGLDMDLTTLLVWLAKNRSIRHLSLGKNFNNIKSKNLSQVLNNLVLMIQEEDSPLTSLSLADSKLKAELTIVLNALGSNTSLTKLDVSGNAMGDMGAKMLAKALQINTKLRTVIWDKNNVSPQGLQDVAAALEKNFTIRFMPVPIMDAAQALKASPEKTEDALLKMEQYLLRNHETRKYLQEQAYRLQQGIVTTTTQQVIDRKCVKVQDHLNSLRFSETYAVQEDMRVAENLMKDARNSKRLLPNLYHLRSSSSGRERASTLDAPSMAPIQEKLESMAGEIVTVMEQQLQTLLQTMVDTAEGLCPHVMKKSSLRQELVKASAAKMAVPRSFITTTLMEQSGVDIINKISEVKLNMASVLCDRIVDEILDSLSQSQHTLAEHLNRPLVHKHPQETEVLDEMVLQTDHQNQEQKTDHRLEETDTCAMTPKSKRQSILFRMLRPVSVAFELEFDLDKALEEVPIHEEDLPPPPSPLSPLDFGELPTVEVRKLEHHTKLRPKPNKRNKPSKTAAGCSVTEEVDPNDITATLDEGVEDFFTKKVTRLSFLRLSLRGSASSSANQEVSEKKRESRKSGFLNLIKSRASRSEKSHVAAAVAPQPSGGVVTVTEEPPSPREMVRDVPSFSERREFPRERSHSSPERPEQEGVTSHAVQEEHHDKAHEEKAHDEKAHEEKVHEENLDGDKSHGEKPHGEKPHGPVRHFGVPMMGMGKGSNLLAEMKAMQEKKAAHKHKVMFYAKITCFLLFFSLLLQSSLDKTVVEPAKPESHGAGTDSVDSRPDPASRYKLPTVSPRHSPTQANKPSLLAPRSTGAHGGVSPQPSNTHIPGDSTELPVGISAKVPLPAPRLKRVPSDQERENSACVVVGPMSPPLGVELSRDGGPFDLACEADQPDAAGRQWSSLKHSTSPAVLEEDRARTKSLPDNGYYNYHFL